MGNNDKRIEIIIKYFKAVDSKNLDAISLLFDQEVEIFFPQSGLLNGLGEFNKLNQELTNFITSLEHDIDNFIYTISDSRIVVEGTESGTLRNNQSFTNNKFCSVFEIDSISMLIKRMYVYTDPTFGTSR
ncbi:nuclear transport factor 2 family protein [Bacillus gaemokensis]|uniref:SnoaL-like domain-containing protein n=1 Tax=Bacillus gaemokensis TaxID=574375 RepID=A0A073KDI1_9BACI|nr:nuclear transport factor 2 family protein [Bacillus gaemokensis]KEK25319.1 hypothetical protein BAGA_11865 [Bacillus gaemokensis]KYG37237.1 hypothetical protein AZF08_07475 [Bacillus gaemokensis]